jgi:HD-GYP domain-containing protein (c-di-GMP phosphodiesterase class II)
VAGPAPQRPLVEAVETTDSYLRSAGRDFLFTFYAALRSLKLYPLENAQVQKTLDDLCGAAQAVLDREREIELRVAGEFLFVNSTRLRLDLDNYASFSHVLGMLAAAGAGLVRAEGGADRREWTAFLSLLLAGASRSTERGRVFELQAKLAEAGVTHIAVEPPVETERSEEDQQRAKERAKQTYQRSVAVTKEVINSVRMGRTASVKKVKRVVQTIVDQVLADETSLIGLSTLRDYDDYTFTHSVNVCIFSVALGKKLGLSKLQLCDLGMAALLHDVGKSRVPLELLHKEGSLSDEDWRVMQAHPWLGVLTLFGLRGYGEVPYRSMIAAYEHHMKRDLTGYPKCVRPRTPSIFSQIIAVADGFDAATTGRVYDTVPMQPDSVLHTMLTNPRRGLDQVVVKAFINLLGVYPVGTMVILDTYELALVVSANPDTTEIHRPVVRVISDPGGIFTFPGVLANLAEKDAAGTPRRTIIKVTDPAKYGIRPSDDFV